MREKIIKYLTSKLLGSMILYFVNGTPEKRLFRTKELATFLYNKMNENEKRDMLKKIKNDDKPPI